MEGKDYSGRDETGLHGNNDDTEATFGWKKPGDTGSSGINKRPGEDESETTPENKTVGWNDGAASDRNYENEWKTVRLIGSGSFGSVYEFERRTGKHTYHAALKVISIPQSEDEIHYVLSNGIRQESLGRYFQDSVDDLTDEIQIMYDLAGHNNIVSYQDHKVVPHPDGIGADIYIRMELLTSLGDYLKQHQMTRNEVIKLGIDMCEALRLCEKKSIIHRDIKPDNIFVSDSGDFKLGDFGIARTISASSMGHLSVKGTPNYMAPEIYHGKHYDRTVDIYSLGIVLYQLMNGKCLPLIHENSSVKETLAAFDKRMNGEILPPPEKCDTDFARVILKACAYDPKKRYQSAEEMQVDLKNLLEERGKKKKDPGGSGGSHRNRVAAVAAVVAAAVIAVFVGTGVNDLPPGSFLTGAYPTPINPQPGPSDSTGSSESGGISVITGPLFPTDTPTPTPTPTPSPSPTPTVDPFGHVDWDKGEVTLYAGIKASAGDFLFPDSSESEFTAEDFASYMDTVDEDLLYQTSQLVVNEIYARHGYTFGGSSETSKQAKAKFENMEWYKEVQPYCPSDESNELYHLFFNDVERANIKTVQAWQKEHGLSGNGG